MNGHTFEWVQMTGIPTVTLMPGGNPLQAYYEVGANVGTDKLFRFYVDRNTQIEQYTDTLIRTTPFSTVSTPLGVFMTDYRKSSKTRLVEALNKANPKYPILADNLLFGNAVSWVHTGRNSKVTLTPNNGNLAGKRTIHYNRLDLATLFASLNVTALVLTGTETTTHDVLPLILAQYGVNLLPEEIINEPIIGDNIVIHATPSALGWTGFYNVATDADDLYVVMGLDDGSGFILDNGAFLLNS